MVRRMTEIRLTTVSAAAVVLLLAASGTATAVDRFVATTGVDDGNDCASAAAPCRNIWFAMNAATDGDVIKVAAGSYVGVISHNALILKTAMTVSGGWNAGFTARDPRTNVTKTTRGKHTYSPRPLENIDGYGTPLVLTLDGLTFTGGTEAAIQIRLLNQELTVVLRDCVLSGNRGPYTAGIFALTHGTSVLHLVLDGCTLTRNRTTAAAEALGGAIGFWAFGSSLLDVTLRNTAVYGNFAPTGGAAVGATSNEAATVRLSLESSTIFGNRSPKRTNAAAPLVGAIGVQAPGGAAQLTLVDSIVWGNVGGPGKDVYAAAGAGSLTVSADHNIVGDQVLVGATYNDLGGNLSLDPQLVNPRRDPHLRATSPAIDAGTCAGVPASDFEGDPRPTGAACDIGADEHVP